MTHILLLGGGMDSAVMAQMVKATFTKNTPFLPQDSTLVALHVNYGQKAHLREVAACRAICKYLNIPLIQGTMPLSGTASSIMRGTKVGDKPEANCLPGRNVLLATYAAVNFLPKGGTIYLGFHRESDSSPFPDARMDWFLPWENAMKSAGVPVLLAAPLGKCSQQDIYECAYENFKEAFQLSYSCYEEQGPCGVCVHCQTRTSLMEELATRHLGDFTCQKK